MKAVAILSYAAAVSAAAAGARPQSPGPVAPPKNPNSYEMVTISSLTLVKNIDSHDHVEYVDFVLDGNKAHALNCKAQNPKVTALGQNADIIDCEGSKYRFALHPGTSDANIVVEIWHELGPAFGFYGHETVAINCPKDAKNPAKTSCTQTSTFVSWAIDIDGKLSN
ncbi:hypothetical protein E4U42_000433 [Claviceps africana]|uniref:AA1-like domain-containing protein n=1 Tax=Claviceps africana TaxID=83212 RepID=A0A8K0NKS0_9HYPO|nr:hypothetical protein E4U42_000433 [Claviceps africana]